MAEYFPLLDRAVSGLTEPTAEARRSIYERARAALLGQLRRMEPPIPDEDIARESAALDEAIARVEAGFADHHGPEPAPAAQPSVVRTNNPPDPARSAPEPAALPRPGAPPLPTGRAPTVVVPSRERPVLGPRPAPARDRPVLPVAAPPVVAAAGGSPRTSPRAAGSVPLPAGGAVPPRGTRPVMGPRPISPPPTAEEGKSGGLPTAGRLISEAAATAAMPLVDKPGEAVARGEGTPRFDDAIPRFDEVLEAAGRPDRDGKQEPPSPRPRDAAFRPPAPRPRQAPRFGWPAMTFGLGALAVAVGIGVAAYRMRDKPEQVVAARAGVAASQPAASGKVVDRASPAAAGDADPAAGSATGTTVPASVPQGLDTGAGGPAITVAQRAALLVDAPDDPQRVKTYVGTVVWHLDSVSPGSGQPLATAVRADIDLPDAQLKVTMLMQKNPEPQLPASHTIEFHFLPQPGNTLGNVKQVNVPEMRKDDDAATGDPLAGVPVAITDNYFLVGLSRGGAEAQNMRLISERNWLDMSVLFVSGSKLGKLTFEKGATGQRTFDDALKAWK